MPPCAGGFTSYRSIPIAHQSKACSGGGSQITNQTSFGWRTSSTAPMEELGSNHMAIGPSHFLRSDLNEEWIGMIWEHSVLPYIAEQYFGDDSRLEAFALEKLRQPKATVAPIE